MCLNVLAVGRFHSAAGEGRWMERLRDVQSLAGQTAGETHRTAASVVAVAAALKLTRCVHFNDTASCTTSTQSEFTYIAKCLYSDFIGTF